MLGLALWGSTSGAQTRPDTVPGWEATMDDLIREALHGDTIPSLAVGIVQDGEVVYAKAFGIADRTTREAASTGTLYQIGSVTKMFVGNLAARLIVEDSLSLLTPAALLFPSHHPLPIDKHANSIDLLHLLTHTASIGPYPANVGRVDGDAMRGYPSELLLDALDALRLDGPIGERFAYSNLGYGMVGTGLELKFGRSLDDLVRSKVAIPLRMRNTGFVPTADERALMATPYRKDAPFTPTTPWDMGALSGAGGLYSSLDDLLLFLRYQMEPDDAARLQQTPFARIDHRTGYGLGCFVGFSASKNTRIIHHGGDLDGFAADLSFLPEERFGMVILTNCGVPHLFGPATGQLFNKAYELLVQQAGD